MPDRVIVGGAPQASEIPGSPPGTLWIEVLQRAADATGKTIKVNVYCTNMPRYIGVQLGGPAYEMEGGPFIAQVFPSAWEYAPSGGSPGLALTTDIVVARPGFYNIEAEAGGLRGHVSCQLGTPDEGQTGPYYSADAIRDNTYLGRQEKMREEVKDMVRPNPIIGTGTKLKRTQSKSTR